MYSIGVFRLKVPFCTAVKQPFLPNFALNQGLETSPSIYNYQLITKRMANNKDIAWTPILYCVGAGIAGIALGTFLVAPMVQKMKAKKLAEKKKTAIASPTKK
tara:strand:+ start:32388 stop:32696 length:309 start_codon:yes stop_codon:yes gene_type:complete